MTFTESDKGTNGRITDTANIEIMCDRIRYIFCLIVFFGFFSERRREPGKQGSKNIDTLLKRFTFICSKVLIQEQERTPLHSDTFRCTETMTNEMD